VVELVARRAALGACPLNSNGMLHDNVDLPFFNFQFHSLDMPGIGDPEDLGLLLTVLNGSSPSGTSPLQAYLACAEDRAIPLSNTGADSGTKTDAESLKAPHIDHYLGLRIGIKAPNPGALGNDP
jgi:hypothetical protein